MSSDPPMGTAASHNSGEAAAMLLFDSREAPGVQQIVRFAAGQDDVFALVGAAGRIELRHGAMTFDLIVADKATTGSASRSAFASIGGGTQYRSALALVPAPHIAPGANTVPVLREWLSLAARLAAALPSVRAIGWTPARLTIGPDDFCRIVAGWLSGGPFPTPATVALLPEPSGSWRSEGLAFLAGRELRIVSDHVRKVDLRGALLAQLVDYLVHREGTSEAEILPLESGDEVRLVPAPDGRMIEVSAV